MFEMYEAKPVIRCALQIRDTDSITQFNETSSILVREHHEVKFTHTNEVQRGDYIIRESESDIYHCPQAVFIEKYRPLTSPTRLSFGQAIEAAKSGLKIARSGWNGKNMFVVYMPPLKLPPHNTEDTARKVNDRTAKFIGEDQPLDCQPYLAMYNAQKQWIPGWLASQSDMLAEDWLIVA